MKHLLIVCLLLFPLLAQAKAPTEAEIEEKIKKIQYLEDIFFLRMTLLNEKLSVLDAELKMTEDSYQKTLILEQIRTAKEDMEQEKSTLKNRIIAIENDLKQQPPSPEVSERINKAKLFFEYFKK